MGGGDFGGMMDTSFKHNQQVLRVRTIKKSHIGFKKNFYSNLERQMIGTLRLHFELLGS